MFADSLLDAHFTGRSQRGWTTLTSFALQSVAIAALLTLPLLYTEGLPKLHVLSVSAPMGLPPGRPPSARSTVRRRAGFRAICSTGSWSRLPPSRVG